MEDYYDEYYFREVVKSLFSEEPDLEYVDLYLSDSDFRSNCNKMISEVLFKEFFDRVYNIDGCLNFLNNVVSKQLQEKPYLSELNIIINTINGYIEKNKEIMASLSEEKKSGLREENSKLISMLVIISDEFIMKYDLDTEVERKIAKEYEFKMNNDIPLTKEEVEELLSFYLVSGFSIYNDDNSNKPLDYALKNILENDYEIDEFLYKKLFVYTCKNEANKMGIGDVDLLFVHDKDFKDEMNFDWNSKLIRINNRIFKENGVIQNYIAFFHEINHYKQHSEKKEDLQSFLAAKDLYLSIALGEEYYNSNYINLFVEKDASYKSYEDVYNFVIEKAPNAVSKVADAITASMQARLNLESSDIYKRVYKGKEEDINILFDRTLRKNNDFVYTIIGKGIINSLLVEYDVTGKKRSIFELLEGMEYATEHNIPSRCEIYNYLLYDELVTYEYISDNLKLLEDEENRKKYGKYYDEAKRILEKKEIDCKEKMPFRKANKEHEEYKDEFDKINRRKLLEENKKMLEEMVKQYTSKGSLNDKTR